MERLLLALSTCTLTVGTFAQVNAPGRFQIGLAISGGAHSTHFTNSYSFAGLKFENSDDGSAATVAYPLDLHVGLSNRFSLGLCLEPGQYIDSAGTHPNQFMIVSLSPRFYALNKERNALLFNLDLGVSGLRIGDVVNGTKQYDDSYAGLHVRPGMQYQHYFGSTFGLNLGFKVPFHNLKWRDRDPEDPGIAALNYEAELRTAGVQFQLGIQVKL